MPSSLVPLVDLAKKGPLLFMDKIKFILTIIVLLLSLEETDVLQLLYLLFIQLRMFHIYWYWFITKVTQEVVLEKHLLTFPQQGGTQSESQKVWLARGNNGNIWKILWRIFWKGIYSRSTYEVILEAALEAVPKCNGLMIMFVQNWCWITQEYKDVSF